MYFARSLWYISSEIEDFLHRIGGENNVRDYQRSKVYKAEREFIKDLDDYTGCLRDTVFEKSFDSVDDISKYVDDIVDSDWFKRCYCFRRAVTIKDGRGRSRPAGSFSSYTMWMPRWARSEVIVLHELAHIMYTHTLSLAIEFRETNYKENKESAHGREFVKRFIWLVGHVMGSDAAQQLSVRMLRNRVAIYGTDAEHFARLGQ